MVKHGKRNVIIRYWAKQFKCLRRGWRSDGHTLSHNGILYNAISCYIRITKMKTNIDEVKELKALGMPGLVCSRRWQLPLSDSTRGRDSYKAEGKWCVKRYITEWRRQTVNIEKEITAYWGGNPKKPIQWSEKGRTGEGILQQPWATGPREVKYKVMFSSTTLKPTLICSNSY